MQTFGIEVRFDGTDYAGWQVQPGRRTVQGEIEGALLRLFGTPLCLRGAGRTDAGVHALRAVGAFDADTSLDGPTIARALGAFLPPDILLLRAAAAPERFDPRRSALSRTYLYRILAGRDPFRRRYVWERRTPLRLGPMNRAAADLLGERDHTSFAASTRKGRENTVRVDRASWEEEGDEIRFTITANRFLHHMVRNIVGTLVEIGEGKRTAEGIASLLEARDRRLAGPTVPARGLFLVDIDYGGDWSLPVPPIEEGIG